MGFRAYKCLVTLFLCSLLTFFLSSCVLNIKNPLRYYLWPVETPPLKEIAKKDQVASKSPSRKDSLVSAANSDGNVEITLSQAILVGLQNNKVFQVDKLKPPITSSAEEVERAAFDPVVRAALEKSRLRSDFYTVNKDFKASAGFDGKATLISSLREGRRTSMSEENSETVEILGNKTDAVVATVISKDDDVLEIMDPETFRAALAARPRDLQVEPGEEVKAVRTADGFIVL